MEDYIAIATIFLSIVILANLLGILTEYGMQKFGKEKDMTRVKKCTVTALTASVALSLITLSSYAKVPFGDFPGYALLFVGFAMTAMTAYLQTFYVEL